MRPRARHCGAPHMSNRAIQPQASERACMHAASLKLKSPIRLRPYLVLIYYEIQVVESAAFTSNNHKLATFCAYAYRAPGCICV